MQGYKNKYSIVKMAKVLGVSRSGYYAFEKRKLDRRKQEDIVLTEVVKRIFADHRGRYGSPRVWAELKSRGWRVGRKRVERLMREHRLRARVRRKWVKTTNSRHNLSVSENILNRDFRAFFPGEK